MEFTAGAARDGFYITGDLEKQATSSAHRSPFPLSSPSASPATTSPVFRWHVGPSGCGGRDEDGSKGSNFFLEKEHMFDKVVTPSDVGKLNRLVIPKQHAEKYFPLDPAANEKGLLLSFEDRTGRSWRFRYSYWNSSQSYVMTKGWSRFVKDKRLDAGDVVSFGRGLGDPGRDLLYIDWKPRPENHRELAAAFGRLPMAPLTRAVSFGRSLGPSGVCGVGGGVGSSGRFLISPGVGYDNHHRPGFVYNAMSAGGSASGGHLLFFRSSAGAPPPPHIGVVQHEISGGYGGSGSPSAVLNSLPLAGNQAEAKRIRLFGVNLDGVRPEARAGGGGGSEAQLAIDRSIDSALPFLPFPYMSVESSMVAVASPSAEPHLTLDLGL